MSRAFQIQTTQMFACVSFRWRPEIDILMDQLAVKISQGNLLKKAATKTTEPQEFALTEPKPRPLPMPELIPQQKKCKPVSISYIKSFTLRTFHVLNP